MKRQLLCLVIAALLLATGVPQLLLPVTAAQGIAHARGGGDDGGDRGGDDGGGDDGGGGDNSGRGGGHDDDHDEGRDDDRDDDTSGRGRGRGGSDGKAGSGGLAAEGLRRIYDDGRVERISAGLYERLDARGRVTERRTATTADRRRLADPKAAKGITSVIDIGQNRVTITDRAGWRETLDGRTYQLTDPRGNLVTRRPATADDLGRFRGALDLR